MNNEKNKNKEKDSMGRKKHLKDVDQFDMEFINSKMNNFDRIEMPTKIDYKINIKCKNKHQKDFLTLLKKDEKKICFGMGSAGSGKSYISLAYGLQALKNLEFDQIIILVPTCQAGSKEISLGYLKGELEAKINPFLEADQFTIEKILKDSNNINHRGMAQALICSQKIKYELVQFARGKTYDNSLIMINESENYNKDEILLMLTRLGENSKIIITGDEQQKDRKDIKGSSGMSYAYEKLKELDEVGEITFTDEDVVRNPLISKILNVWNN